MTAQIHPYKIFKATEANGTPGYAGTNSRNADANMGVAVTVGRPRVEWRPPHHEDSAYYRRSADGAVHVLGVFDGMGGHAAGDVASSMAAEHLDRQFEALVKTTKVNAANAVAESLRSIHARLVAGIPAGEEMPAGTTAVVARIDSQGNAHYSHAGDSRAYLWRSNGTLEQLTEDHEDAKLHPRNPPLTSCLGPAMHYGRGTPPTISRGSCKLENGDAIILATDGVEKALSQADLLGIMSTTKTAQAAAARIVQLAHERGVRDNASAVVHICTAEFNRAKQK